jgi:predicted dehydrogenase
VKRKPSIGVLGLGSMGSRHAANFKKLGCEVVGYDIAFSELDSLKKAMDCDAIVIASPTAIHYHHIVGADLFKKPMFVEKPIVMTRNQFDLVPTTNIKMVGYNLRFHSCVKIAKKRYRNRIGIPIWANFVCAQFNERPDYLRDGVILNWSHEIDLARYLLDPMGNTTLAAANSYEGRVADIILKHSTMLRSTIHLDYLTRPERRGFVIVGTMGVIEVNLVRRTAELRDTSGNIVEFFTGQDSFEDNYMEEAQYFLDLLDGRIRPEDMIGCSAKEGMLINRICLEAMGL